MSIHIFVAKPYQLRQCSLLKISFKEKCMLLKRKLTREKKNLANLLVAWLHMNCCTSLYTLANKKKISLFMLLHACNHTIVASNIGKGIENQEENSGI